MQRLIAAIWISLTASFLNAQSIDIKGMVKDSASGVAVPGVIVALLHAEISDTINHDGTFHLVRTSVAINAPVLPARDMAPTINGLGIMTFGIENRELVTVSTYTIRGKLVSRLIENKAPGMHTLQLPQAASEILLHRIRIANASYVLKTSGAGKIGSFGFGTVPETAAGLQSALAKQADPGFRDTLVVVLNGKEVTRREILNPIIPNMEIKAALYFTLRYADNGSTSGAAPETQEIILGAKFPLATNTGDLVREGYTFAGWNTSADGSGADYPAGVEYTMDGNMILYAKWKTLDVNAMTLVFDFLVPSGHIYYKFHNTVTLPLMGDVDVVVDWGDGNSEVFTTPGAKTHTYSGFGKYIVSITGTLSGFGWELEELEYGDSGPSHLLRSMSKLVKVRSFGKLGLTNLHGAFSHAYNLVEVPTELPATVTNLGYSFYGSGKNLDISSWDVGNVINMIGMFMRSSSIINQDIGNWNTANVKSMARMFDGNEAFNQDIGGWDVGKVTDMSFMFHQAKAFNQDIGSWDVRNVTDMSGMFSGAETFNQDVGEWDVGKVTNMSAMFYSAAAFNQDVSGWDTKNVTDMSSLFSSAAAFNQDISGWDIGKVVNMSWMFAHTSTFNQDIGGWNVRDVRNMSGMFSDAESFDQDIGGWDVGKVTDMSRMFSAATSFNQDISGWNVVNVSNMTYMFGSYYPNPNNNFNPDISNWNTSSVEFMTGMFANNTAFNQDISGWDVGNAIRMNSMFKNAASFNRDLSKWCVTKISTRPYYFDRGAKTWIRPNSLPVWGTCPEIPGAIYFAIQYAGNGNTGGPVPESQRKRLGVKLVLATNTGDMIREGHSFSGWNTSADGSGTDYAAGAEYSGDGDLTLYAMWKPIDVKAMMLVFNIPSSLEPDHQSWDREVALPLMGDVDVIVDWGDGDSEAFTSPGKKTHTYSRPGHYTVSISGNLSGFGWESNKFVEDKGGGFSFIYGIHNLEKVLSFGKIGLTSLQGAFAEAASLVEVPSELPASVTNLRYTFARAPKFNFGIGGWDVSNVTNMSGMFYDAALFNQDIGKWDVGNVTDMSNMFSFAHAFNQDIGNWNTSKVRSMSYMFRGTEEFNQDISNWDVGNVTDMHGMFLSAQTFNQDVGEWDVGNVKDMSRMFCQTNAFNQNIGNWNTSKVESMESMFQNNTVFNQNLSNWCVSRFVVMPPSFDHGATSWTLPNSRPIWGTCPSGKGL